MNLDSLNSSSTEEDLINISPSEEALKILFEKADQGDVLQARELVEKIYEIAAKATDDEREDIVYSNHGKKVFALIQQIVSASHDQNGDL